MNDEPWFMVLRESDPEYQGTIVEARRSLPVFRALIAQLSGPAAHAPCVKTRIVDGEESAPMWLAGAKLNGSGFTAYVFEMPAEFKMYKSGDRVDVVEADVLDWMLNQDGVLFGGFSLRYQRSKLPSERRVWFDEYVGVNKYADLPGEMP